MRSPPEDFFDEANITQALRRPILLGVWLVFAFFVLLGTWSATTTFSSISTSDGEVWDVSPVQPLIAKVSGTIVLIQAVPGKKVGAGQSLLKISVPNEDALAAQAHQELLVLLSKQQRWLAAATHTSMGPVPKEFNGDSAVWQQQAALLDKDRQVQQELEDRLMNTLVHRGPHWKHLVEQNQYALQSWMSIYDQQAQAAQQQIQILLPSVQEKAARTQEALLDQTVKSPIDGRLHWETAIRVGSQVQQGMLLGQVSASDHFVVRAHLSLRDSLDLKLGMPGQALLFGPHGGLVGRLQGRVTRISAMPALLSSPGADTVQVEMNISLPAQRLESLGTDVHNGQRAQVVIETSSGSVLWYLLQPLLRRMQSDA